MGEKKNKRRRETDLLATGRREVEGQPPDGPREWRTDELEGGLDDLRRGLRCASRFRFRLKHTTRGGWAAARRAQAPRVARRRAGGRYRRPAPQPAVRFQA